MFKIEKTIVSEELIEQDFVCDLNKCKGACCVEGEGGAPLEKDELPLLADLYPKVKPLLTKSGIDVIEREGFFVETESGEFETPLVEGRECVYLSYENGHASCAFEQIYNRGDSEWKKPISCHLYPVRTKEYSVFTAVNYHRWQICSDACDLGKELKVPLYVFVKEALIRKFGNEWYEELEQTAKEYRSK